MNINKLKTNENCVIEFPSDSIRSRKVVKRSNYKPTLKFPSHTAGRMLHCESALERDAAVILDVDPSVTAIFEQPACIHYKQGANWRKHYPDFLIRKNDRNIFIEIKHSSKADEPCFVDRTVILKQQLKSKGFYYIVLTDNEIQQQPRLKNSREVHCLGKASHSTEEQKQNALKVISSENINSLGALKKALPNSDYSLFYWLTLNGFIEINFSEEWTLSTAIKTQGGSL